MTIIKAVLHDAEQSPEAEESVRHCLEKPKMQLTVLKMYQTSLLEILRPKLEIQNNLKGKVRNFFVSPTLSYLL